MKLLLVSDSGMNINGGGFQQTLYNIFSFLKPEDFLLITSRQSNKVARTSPPFSNRVITYNMQFVPLQHNRLGRYINNFISLVNLHINKWFNNFSFLKKNIKNFNPDVIVVAPNSAEGILIYSFLNDAFKSKKVFPYFMDDWLYQLKKNKKTDFIHLCVKQLLKKNTCWMMISEGLTKIFQTRYSIQPDKLLVIHNPIEFNNAKLPEPPVKKEKRTIAYAGSLWQMHFDALILVAKAIQLIKEKRKIELIIYTSESNWKWRQSELSDLDVVYGGLIPYDHIHSKLSDADCLLLTSSFAEDWQTHSKGSLQTKITDYLKAGRLIISCGPDYSINHFFLKKNQCGICIETNSINKIAEILNSILDNMEANQQFVLNGYELLKQEFSFEKIHQKLIDFIAA